MYVVLTLTIDDVLKINITTQWFYIIYIGAMESLKKNDFDSDSYDSNCDSNFDNEYGLRYLRLYIIFALF